MNGVLIIDKPEGLTSAEVVRQVKRKVHTKVGHLGTLDPFATGLLPLCLGEATKIAQFLNTSDKSYEGSIRLGMETDSADRTGNMVRLAPLPELDERRLQRICLDLTGESMQVPPMYSALKRSGTPLYQLARRGIDVERAPRPVFIAALRLQIASRDRLRFEVDCSKGTYIRVLAQDIGLALGSAAHLETLRRTRFGRFGIGQAVPLEHWNARESRGLLSIREALSHLPSFPLDQRAARAARAGQPWVLTEVARQHRGEMAALVDPDDAVAAVVVKKEGKWSFGRVLRDVRLYNA
jgi:tRNA pseudouridine55 synthase